MKRTSPSQRLKRVIARFDEVNAYYIRDLASQIASIRDDEAALYVLLLALLNAKIADVNSQIEAAVALSMNDIRLAYSGVADDVYNRYRVQLKKSPLSAQASQRIADHMRRVERDTARQMRRLSEVTNVSQAYQQAANRAVIARDSGLGNYDGLMRPTVRSIGASGIQVTGDDGRHRGVANAVSRYVRDGIYSIKSYVNDVVVGELKLDAVEISVHDNPAPDHEPIQGRVFLRSEFNKLQNHEDCTDIDGRRYPAQVRAIGELNCKHLAYGFSMESSERRYTAEQLDQMADRNAQGCIIAGKHYSLYEANQLAARLESEQKRYKRIAIAADAAGDRVLAADCKQRLDKIEAGIAKTQRVLGIKRDGNALGGK